LLHVLDQADSTLNSLYRIASYRHCKTAFRHAISVQSFLVVVFLEAMLDLFISHFHTFCMHGHYTTL